METPACDPDELDVGLAHGGHSDEIVGSREKGGEGRGERDPVPYLQPDGRSNQLLFGDVHLEVSLGVGLRESVGEGRVADFAVESHYVSTGGAQRGQSVAICFPGCDLVAESVGRRGPGSSWKLVGGSVFRGRVWRHHQVAQSSKLANRGLGVVESLPVGAVFVLHGGHTFPLHRPGDDDGRDAFLSRRLRRRRDRSAPDCGHRPLSRSNRTISRVPCTCERSQPTIVSPRCPSRFTSMIAVRLSSPANAACSKASHIDPSAISLSPQRTQTRYGNRSRCFPARATPTATGSP